MSIVAKKITLESASQEEQNGANFSFIAPSVLEYIGGPQRMSSISIKTPYSIVHGFWPDSENFDFGKKAYHRKEHFKRNRMV